LRTGHVALIVKKRNKYKIMMEKPDGNRQIGRTGIENNKMDLSEIVWGGVGWIDLAQDMD
jgi:hypothetical protein